MLYSAQESFRIRLKERLFQRILKNESSHDQKALTKETFKECTYEKNKTIPEKRSKIIKGKENGRHHGKSKETLYKSINCI